MAPQEVGTAEDVDGSRHRVLIISSEMRKACAPSEHWRSWEPYRTFRSHGVGEEPPTCLMCIAGMFFK